MSVHHSFVPSRVASTLPRVPLSVADAAGQIALDAALQAGRPGAQQLSPALQAYWRLLTLTSPAARAHVLEQLRRAVRNGEASLRAWVPIALGEIDFELVESAVLGYVGIGPVSVEWRARAVADVLDWIRRDLPLNRAAAFAALLSLHDESVAAALGGLRSRLGVQECTAVWQRLADDVHAGTQQFIAEWQAEA